MRHLQNLSQQGSTEIGAAMQAALICREAGMTAVQARIGARVIPKLDLFAEAVAAVEAIETRRLYLGCQRPGR